MKNFEEFEKLEDKASVFDEWDKILNYAQTESELIKLFKYLSDEEKMQVIYKPYFKEQMNIRLRFKIIEELSEQNQMKFIKEEDISGFSVYRVEDLISRFSDNLKVEIIESKKLQEKLGSNPLYITNLITTMKNDEMKFDYMKKLDLEKYQKLKIINSLSFEKRKSILENGEITEFKDNYQSIIGSFSVDELIEFMKSDNEFLKSNNINLKTIRNNLSKEKKIEIAERIDEFSIDESEKRVFIALLDNKIKETIDASKIKPEYRSLLNLKLHESFYNLHSYGRIALNLDMDINDYRGLDEDIYVNVFELLENGTFDIDKIKELCRVCPKISISDNIHFRNSNVDEFLEAEEWFSSVLGSINPEWTDAQKLAHIDYSIGKKISYSPEWDSEAEERHEVRGLSSVINSGYGVCNGIAQVEEYLLKRAGFECEIVQTDSHTYIKVNRSRYTYKRWSSTWKYSFRSNMELNCCKI